MNNIISKFLSRKFLFAVAVFIISLIGVNDETLSIVSSTITAIAYMFSEAIVDKSRAIKRTIEDTACVSKTLPIEDKDNADK
jgi:hypothetical protein